MNEPAAIRRISALSGAQRAFYRAHGYLLVPKLVSEGFLTGVQELLELLVDDTISGWRRAGLVGETFSELAFESRYHEAWIAAGRPSRDDTTKDPRFSARALEDHVALDELDAVAAQVVEAEHVTPLASCFYRARFPDDRGWSVPWHQDAQCLKWISPAPFVTAWIPLVDVSSVNSCLEVSPVGPEQSDLDAAWSSQSGYVCMRQADVDELRQPRAMHMYRGDVLLMSPYLPHRSLTNTGAQIRWSIDLRFAPV